jgi:hypothetical protein
MNYSPLNFNGPLLLMLIYFRNEFLRNCVSAHLQIILRHRPTRSNYAFYINHVYQQFLR